MSSPHAFGRGRFQSHDYEGWMVNLRGRTESLARSILSGRRKRVNGRLQDVAPMAPWISAGVTRCGRVDLERNEDGEVVGTIDNRWETDGSVVQDAVHDAILAALSKWDKFIGPRNPADVANEVGRRAMNWVRTWDSHPGQFIPCKMSRSDTAPTQLDWAACEEQLRVAAAQVSTTQLEHAELAAEVLGKLSDTARRTVNDLLAWRKLHPARTAMSDRCPVHPNRVVQAMSEIGTAMLASR